MDTAKLKFLVEELPALFLTLPADARPKWGRMQAQQMVEHFIDATLLAAGKIPAPQFTPPERIPAMLRFLHSDEPLSQNLPNPLIPEIPPPVRLPDMDTAVSELKRAMATFVNAFSDNPDREIVNPFFGPLNYSAQIQLLHKHAKHHLKQFGL